MKCYANKAVIAALLLLFVSSIAATPRHLTQTYPQGPTPVNKGGCNASPGGPAPSACKGRYIKLVYVRVFFIFPVSTSLLHCVVFCKFDCYP